MASSNVNVKMGVTGVTEFKRNMKSSEDSIKSLENISNQVSFDNLTKGIDQVVSSLESGAKAALNMGKRILDSAKGSTGFADEVKTIVDQYSDMGLTADSYQRMKKVEAFIDTPVDAILTAKQRMSRAAASSKGKSTLEETLGISLNGQNTEDLFWEVGDALLNMGEAFDKESAAQTVFGRSWRELMPLFKAGRDEYNRSLSEQSVLTDEQIDKLGAADDAILSFEQQVELLKNQFWADNADKITEMLTWIIDNKDTVVSALTAIGGAFTALKLADAALHLGQIVEGFKGLGLGGVGKAATKGASNAVTSATAGGAGAMGTGWSMMGGLSTFGPIAAMVAAAKTGWEMIQANLKDPELNKVYGDNGGHGGSFDTMSDDAWRRAFEYWQIYSDQSKWGTEEAFNSRDALYNQLASEGFTMTEDAVSLLENAFDNYMNETDPDGLVAKMTEKFDRMSAVGDETSTELGNVRSANTDMTKAAADMTTTAAALPANVANAVAAAVATLRIVIGSDAVDTIGRQINAGLGRTLTELR